MALYDNDTFEVAGLTFRFNTEPDFDMGAPWENCDGHGPVRTAAFNGYTAQLEKTPGERVLYRGGRNETSYVYDWQRAMQIAIKDSWGLRAEKRPANWETLTKGEKAEYAVLSDFHFLQGWCSDRWQYIRVIVTLLVHDEDGDLVPYCGPLRELFHDALWGVEDLETDYIESLAVELAGGIAREYHAEQVAALEWAGRGGVTV